MAGGSVSKKEIPIYQTRKGQISMDGIFYTLQDFLTYTKGVTYILILAILFAMLGFWRFLTGRDED